MVKSYHRDNRNQSVGSAKLCTIRTQQIIIIIIIINFKTVK